MATKRKLENETVDQKNERINKESIANYATRSEKTSWGRKRNNLEKMVRTDIRPIEDKIMDLQVELQPKYDAVKKLRDEMVESCIHPYDLLVNTDGVVYCKFCNKKMTNAPKG